MERNRGIQLAEEHIDQYLADRISELAMTAYSCWKCWDELSSITDWLEEEVGEYQEFRIPFPDHDTPCCKHGGIDDY